MKNRLLCCLLLFPALLCGCLAGEAPVYTPQWNRLGYLQIYVRGMAGFYPPADEFYMLNTPSDEEAALQEVQRQARKQTSLTPDESSRLAKFLIPEIWEYRQKGLSAPAHDELAAYYATRASEFPTKDWVRGARIFVDEGPDAAKDLAHLEEALSRPGADFRAVATDYYRSTGEEYDGYFSRMERGQIRPALFERFWAADPGAPYFGPVKEEHGFLIGKLYAKGPEGSLPLEEVESDIISDFVRARLAAAERRLHTEAIGHHDIQRMTLNADSIPTSGTMAYTFDGVSYTYQDMLDSFPGVYGDAKSVAFFKALRELAIRSQLILNGPARKEVEESLCYRTLFSALASFVSVRDRIREELGAINASDDVVAAYYEAKKNSTYRAIDQVRIVIVRVSRNPNRATEPRAIHEASLAAWKTASRIYAAFMESENPAAFSFADYANQRGIRIVDGSEWLPIDSFESAVMKRLLEEPEKRTDGLMISPQEYTFYYVLDRRHPLYPPLEQIHDRVKQDYLLEMRTAVWKKYMDAP